MNVTTAGVTAKLAQTAGTFTYLKDALGSIVDVADVLGNRVQHYVYSAYGNILAIQDASANDITSNPVLSTSYTFAGREMDSESGFYYNRARYFDSHLGRFLQQDPSPGKIQTPQSVVNKYIYTGNNPANAIDPSGMISIGSVLGGIASSLGGVVVGIVGAVAAYAAGGVTLFAAACAVAAAALVAGSIAAFKGESLSQIGAAAENAAIGTAIAIVGGVIGGAIAGAVSVSLAGVGTFSGGFFAAYGYAKASGATDLVAALDGLVAGFGQLAPSINPGVPDDADGAVTTAIDGAGAAAGVGPTLSVPQPTQGGFQIHF